MSIQTLFTTSKKRLNVVVKKVWNVQPQFQKQKLNRIEPRT